MLPSWSPVRSILEYPWRRPQASTQLLQSVQIEVSISSTSWPCITPRSTSPSSDIIIEVARSFGSGRGAEPIWRMTSSALVDSAISVLRRSGERSSSAVTAAPGIVTISERVLALTVADCSWLNRSATAPNTSPSRKYCKTRSSEPTSERRGGTPS